MRVRNSFRGKIWRYVIGVLIFAASLGAGTWTFNHSRARAEIALNDFYNYSGFTDKITTPLYEGGPAVVPLVIEKVKDKDMPHRLHAISFLQSKAEAIPVLRQLVGDESEDAYFRKTALWSLFYTDKNSAKKLAEHYRDRNDFLGEYSKCILTKD